MTHLTLSEITLRVNSYLKTQEERSAVYKSGNLKLMNDNELEVTEAEYIELWYHHDHYYHYIDNINQYRPHAKVAEQLSRIKAANPCYDTPSDYVRKATNPMESTDMSLRAAMQVCKLNLKTQAHYLMYVQLMDAYTVLSDYHIGIGNGFKSSNAIAISKQSIVDEDCEVSYLTVPKHIEEAAITFKGLFVQLEAQYRLELLSVLNMRKTNIITYGRYQNSKEGVVNINVSGVMIDNANYYVLI